MDVAALGLGLALGLLLASALVLWLAAAYVQSDLERFRGWVEEL